MPGFEHDVILVGNASHQQTARQLGLANVQRVSAPYHRAVLALPALWRAVRRVGPSAVIHTWSPGATLAARLVCRRRITLNEPAVWPSVDTELVDGSTRQTLRARWGVSELTPVVALLDARAPRSPAMWGALAVGLARECLLADTTEQAVPALVLHPRAEGLSKTLAMLRDVGWRGGVIQDATLDRPWALLPAADLALAHRYAGSGTAALWAVACGVPLIAERGGTVTDRFSEQGGARPVSPDSPREAGYQVLDLIRDAPARKTLAQRAHEIANQQFSVDATTESLHRAYALAYDPS